MNTEERIRQALRDHASTHAVNPALPRSTITKARLSRLATMAGVGIAAIAVAVAGVGVVNAVDDSRREIPPGSGEGASGVNNGRTAPLLLITAEGWTVARADEYGVKMGEVSFENEGQQIELFWRPANTHDSYVEDRAAGSKNLGTITVAGKDAVLFQYEGTTDFTAMWLDGPLSLELRGVFDTVEDYRAVAETLAFVDEETWLAAMPGDTITPDQRAAVVDEMLADIPLHPDVDVEKLKTQHTVSDRYQLGAQVTGAVACAWIEQWIHAIDNGNADKRREAVGAMEGSREWKILIEMRSQGGWSQVVWELADAMTTDDKVSGGTWTTVEESYQSSLGCEDR